MSAQTSTLKNLKSFISDSDDNSNYDDNSIETEAVPPLITERGDGYGAPSPMGPLPDSPIHYKADQYKDIDPDIFTTPPDVNTSIDPTMIQTTILPFQNLPPRYPILR